LLGVIFSNELRASPRNNKPNKVNNHTLLACALPTICGNFYATVDSMDAINKTYKRFKPNFNVYFRAAFYPYTPLAAMVCYIERTTFFLPYKTKRNKQHKETLYNFVLISDETPRCIVGKKKNEACRLH
jgi:hypothetical protein